MSRKGMLMTRAELANLLGITPPTVDRMVAQGCPVAKEGGRGRAYQFNTADVIAWREEGLRSSLQSTSKATEAELLRRELAAKTELAELKLAREKREVAPVSELTRAMSLAFAGVRSNMRTIPDRVPRMIVGEMDERKIKTVLRDEIDQALLALSRETLVEEDDIAEDDEEE